MCSDKDYKAKKSRKIPKNWKEKTLAELGEVSRGKSKHRPRWAEHLYNGPYPFIQTGDVKNSGGRISEYTQTYNKAGLAQSRMWPKDTMCITIAANIAETGVLQFPACFPDSIIGFIADKNKCDVYFVEYLFRNLRSKIQREAIGTVQDNINLKTLDRISFALPPLPEQKAIARILGSLDDKIELNRRMNKTLEDIARAIFKSWFVDFDPVKAKMEGRTPAGVPEEIIDLFPDKLEESELGLKPEGWEVKSFDELIIILSGGTPKTSIPDYWDGNIPWFTARDAPSLSDVFVIKTERYISEAGLMNSSTQILPVNTTIITARGTVGKLALTAIPMAMNQTCYGIRSIHSNLDYFSYFFIVTLLSEFLQRTYGTIFDTITRKTFAAVKVIDPPMKLKNIFEREIKSLINKIRNNLFENRILISMRDNILPKLISGQIRLNEAERLVESNL